MLHRNRFRVVRGHMAKAMTTRSSAASRTALGYVQIAHDESAA